MLDAVAFAKPFTLAGGVAFTTNGGAGLGASITLSQVLMAVGVVGRFTENALDPVKGDTLPVVGRVLFFI
jgi:hypothetical protein